MRWIKGLARKANAAKFEVAVMAMNRARYGSMLSRKRMLESKASAAKRARTDAVMH